MACQLVKAQDLSKLVAIAKCRTMVRASAVRFDVPLGRTVAAAASSIIRHRELVVGERNNTSTTAFKYEYAVRRGLRRDLSSHLRYDRCTCDLTPVIASVQG